jgi:hypothetical protein
MGFCACASAAMKIATAAPSNAMACFDQFILSSLMSRMSEFSVLRKTFLYFGKG